MCFTMSLKANELHVCQIVGCQMLNPDSLDLEELFNMTVRYISTHFRERMMNTHGDHHSVLSKHVRYLCTKDIS